MRQVIAERALKVGEFTLSSGGKSEFYFDLRPVLCNPMYATLAADLICSWAEKNATTKERFDGGLQYQFVGCPAISGILLASAMANAALVTSREWDAPYPSVLYYAPKKHGTGGDLHGGLRAGDQVLLVDDVLTTGRSLLEMIAAIKAAGGHIVRCCVLLDREAGGVEAIEAVGVPVRTVYTLRHFLHYIEAKKVLAKV